MPTQYPGFSVTETLETSQTALSGKLNNIVIVTTRTAPGTALNNIPVTCASTAELTTKIGTVPAVVLGSFERIRSIAPSAVIWVCPGLDAGGSPTQTQNLVAGLNALVRASTLPLAIVVIPEVAGMASQTDRTSVNAAAEAMVSTNGFDFLHFGNLAAVTDTKAKADTEVALYAAPQGNSSYYWGLEKDSANRDIPIAVSAAAWQVQLMQTLSGFYPPAGNRCPINGSIDAKYLPTFDEASSIMGAKGSYNFAWSVGGRNFLWNDTTRSSDDGWSYINSRLAMSTIQSWVSEQLGDLQFSPADPNPDSDGIGSTTRELVGRLTTIAERAKAEGAIVAYTIQQQAIVAGRARLVFRVRPIQSSKFIEVSIVNTSNP